MFRAVIKGGKLAFGAAQSTVFRDFMARASSIYEKMGMKFTRTYGPHGGYLSASPDLNSSHSSHNLVLGDIKNNHHLRRSSRDLVSEGGGATRRIFQSCCLLSAFRKRFECTFPLSFCIPT